MCLPLDTLHVKCKCCCFPTNCYVLIMTLRRINVIPFLHAGFWPRKNLHKKKGFVPFLQDALNILYAPPPQQEIILGDLLVTKLHRNLYNATELLVRDVNINNWRDIKIEELVEKSNMWNGRLILCEAIKLNLLLLRNFLYIGYCHFRILTNLMTVIFQTWKRSSEGRLRFWKGPWARIILREYIFRSTSYLMSHTHTQCPNITSYEE